jgi:ligand-binding sensor domain-containing protein/signal transduction histidine kinase
VGHLIFTASLSYAQDIKFNHITTDDGLANGNVRSIIQDHQGFFWFGTEDGLQRYDGYSLVDYRHDAEDSLSISSNFVLRLFEDSKQNLWIGSLDAGLCWYNRKENNFRCFKNIPGDPSSLMNNLVRVITESSDGKLYIGLRDGGFSYFSIPDTIPDKINFTNVVVEDLADPGSTWISHMIEDKDKTMLLALNGGGIQRYDPKANDLHEILKDTISNRTQRLMLDSRNRLWISTWGDGLYVYDQASGRLAHHTAGSEENRLDHNQLEDVHEDHEGNVWISTDNGLSFLHNSFDPFGDCDFVNYTHNEFEPASLLGNSIKAFYRDKLNRLWIATYFGGINIYDEHALKFNRIRSKVWDEGSLSNSNVSAFAEDSNGDLWIGTDGGGLNYLKGGVSNIHKETFERIEIKVNGQRPEKIKSLEFDNNGNLWIGTWSFGLVKYNPVTKAYKHYTAGRDQQGLLVNQIMTLKHDDSNNLWIGTFNGGLSRLDIAEDRFTHHPNLAPNDGDAGRYNIKTIHIDKKGRLWVAAEMAGLRVLDSLQASFRIIENDVLKKDITILSIFEDDQGTLWLGTNAFGLIRYDPEGQTTKLYNEKSGLPNNVIYAIEQDVKSGNLWLSSNRGLSEFNPNDKTIKNYNRIDGLQGSQYNPESSLRASDGTLLFGGINGMDAFVPAVVKPRSHLPDIMFTNFFLSNNEVNVNDPGSPLKENIILAREIELQSNQNSFSLGFAMLEYSFSDRNRYAYTLEGLNDSWQQIGSERKVTFTNLSPGTYKLKVKASNSDGVWTAGNKELTIRIQPAWWQTTAFRISLFALSAITLVSAVRLRISYLERQKRKLKRKVRQRTQQLRLKNQELTEKINEIKHQNKTLHKQQIQIIEKNNEIQAQNEELTAQNDQIILQREDLRVAKQKLKEINEQLEVLVDQRTKKLEETIQQLDKTVTELDRFVYSASHDLSAPLKSVLGLVQIARLEKERDRLGEYYSHIEFSVQKLDRVIKSMVEFSRNYHLDVQTDYFNFHDLVTEVLRELAFWPEARRIEFRNTVDKESFLKSDPQRIKVVLHNLISNSVKYADFSKTDSYIHIDFRQNGHGKTILIADNGMGIESGRQARIFEMYYRATDRSHGSGLGLFIVKEIILKLGGTIEVKSTYGSGSTFVIQIPTNSEF